jgi:hypothetical protein
VKLSALCTGRSLPLGRSLVLVSVKGHRARAIVRLERLGQVKNPVTSSGIESATGVKWYDINVKLTGKDMERSVGGLI